MTDRDGRAAADLVGIEAVRAAALRIAGAAIRSPLVRFGTVHGGAGSDDEGPAAYLKAESLQPIGAFKIRGATNAIASLSPEVRARGVVTHSSGNHAQGVARAAKRFGIPALIVMPPDAPAVKRARVEADGAEILTVGPSSGEREAMAERLARERGLTLVPPYDDDRVIAGQGTVGLEIVEELPDVGLVLVPIGGGGLASGVAVAVKALAPGARVVGVESELAADAAESLAAGHIVRWDGSLTSRTIADGTRSQSLGTRTFAHLAALLDDIVTVSEAEIAAGVRVAAEEARLVIEPSGALPVAALRFRPGACGADRAGGPVVAVVSGGNVDPDRYLEFLKAPIPPVR